MKRLLRPIAIVLLAIAASGVFTMMAIWDSQRRGRLAEPPNYDDTEYFCDALRRLNVVETQGIMEMLRTYVNDPPHSPFSSVLALVCYSLFGRVDWAPYAGNAIIVLASLLFVAWMTRRMPLAASLVLMGMTLCVPVSAYAVHEFQPAIACGLATAIAAVGLATAEVEERTWKRAILFGLALAAAYLTKPTVFPLTTLIVGSAATFLVARSLINNDERESRRRTIGFAMGTLAVGVGIFAPLLTAAGPRLVDYIVTNIFGSQKHLWVLPGDWTVHWLYFAFGNGKELVRDMIYPLLAGCAVGVIFLGRKTTAGPWRGLAALLLTTAVAYSLLSMNAVKNPLWGGVFVYLLLFSAVYVGASIVERLPVESMGRTAAVATAAIAMFVGMDRFHFAGSQPMHPSLQAVARDVYRLTHGVARDHAKIFVTGTGRINRSSICYQLLRDGVRSPVCTDCYDSEEIEDYRREIADSDLVIASEKGTGLEYAHFPACQFLDQSFELVRASPDYVELGSAVSSLTGKRFVIFARRSYLTMAGDDTVRR